MTSSADGNGEVGAYPATTADIEFVPPGPKVRLTREQFEDFMRKYCDQLVSDTKNAKHGIADVFRGEDSNEAKSKPILADSAEGTKTPSGGPSIRQGRVE